MNRILAVCNIQRGVYVELLYKPSHAALSARRV